MPGYKRPRGEVLEDPASGLGHQVAFDAAWRIEPPMMRWWAEIVSGRLTYCLTELMVDLAANMDSAIVQSRCLRRLKALVADLERVSQDVFAEGSLSPDAWFPGPPVVPHTPSQLHPLDGPVLTARQCEILRYLENGAAPKEIAHHLHLSETTVRTHIRDAVTRLGVHGAAAAVRVARSRGLLGSTHNLQENARQDA